MSVPVHQTLHGYQRGHRLLASGGDVNDEELALLDRYSDLSGYLPPDLDFEVYHTGFPCGRYYSFAATWPDRENRRGGCVLTHTLLVPKAAAGATGDLWTLGELHRRPESAADSDQVSGALTWEPGESSPPRPDPGRSEAAVALFFGQPDRPVLWMEVAPPADVIRCLWWLAWPGLRRRLAFCTMALQVRSLTGRPFDLLGLPPEAQGAFHDQADSPAWWEHTELRSRRLRELVKQDWVRATIEGGAPAVHRLAAAYRTRRAPDPQPWELGLLWRAETLRPAARERLSAARSYADLLDKLGVPDRHPKWREALRALIDRQEQAPLDPNPLWDLTDLLRRAQLRASLARDGELVEHVQGVVADELLRRLREAPAASASALPELLSVAPPPLVRGLVEATLLATRETRDVSSARSVSAALLTAAFATRDDMLAVRMLETAPDSERAGLVTAVADARSEEEGEGFWEWIASVAGQLREHRLLFDAWVRRGDPAAGIRAVAACLDPDSGAARSVLSEVVEELDPEIVLSWALECQDPRLSEVAAQHAARAAPALSVPLSELARRCADAANGVPVFTALAGTEGSTTLSAALEAEPDLRAAVVGWPQPTPVHFGFERVWDAAFRATPDGALLSEGLLRRLAHTESGSPSRRVVERVGRVVVAAILAGDLGAQAATRWLGLAPVGRWLDTAHEWSLLWNTRDRSAEAALPPAASAIRLLLEGGANGQAVRGAVRLLTVLLETAGSADLEAATEDLLVTLTMDDDPEARGRLQESVLRAVRRVPAPSEHRLLEASFADVYRRLPRWSASVSGGRGGLLGWLAPWGSRRRYEEGPAIALRDWLVETWRAQRWPPDRLVRCAGDDPDLRAWLERASRRWTEPNNP